MSNIAAAAIGFPVIGLAGVAFPGISLAQGAKPITLELNKLEAKDKGCRAVFLVDNTTDAALQSLKLDLVFFGTDGVMIRRLVVDFAPLPPAKKRVKAFDFESPPCGALGSILLNDVAECRGDGGPIADCLQRLDVSSRAKVPLTK